MKKIIYIIILVFSFKTSMSQHRPANYIVNSYINATNEITSVSTLNQLRNSNSQAAFGYNHPYQYEEFLPNSSYYKISYKENGIIVKEGVLDIYYYTHDYRNKNFDVIFEKFLYRNIVDDDMSNYTMEKVIKPDFNAGFVFKNSDNEIYFIFYSKNKPGYLMVTIQINLSKSQKIALANDFINKMQFK